MEARILNRDIKRLHKYYVDKLKGRDNITYDVLSPFVKEFNRLYRDDPEFKYVNKSNVLIMLRLNLLYRFIPLHMFGMNICI